MVLQNSEFISNQTLGEISIGLGEILQVRAYYRIPHRKRPALCTLQFAPRIPINVMPSKDFVVKPGLECRSDRSVTGKTTWRLFFTASALNDFLNESAFGRIIKIQGADVYYEKVEVTVISGLISPNMLPPFVCFSPTTGLIPVTTSEIYKFKSGIGCTGCAGPLKNPNFKALTYRAYPAGVDLGAADKPARILILGTVFASRKEAVADANVIDLITSIKKEINYGTSSNIGMIPVFFVAFSFREAAITQPESLNAVSGSKALEENLRKEANGFGGGD